MLLLRTAALTFAALLTAPSVGLAANSANITRQAFARAINDAQLKSAPYRKVRVSAADIRILRCTGPDEEPTEFECYWRQRTGHGWIRRQTRLAIDGAGWRVID
jgi:hypothetical protein